MEKRPGSIKREKTETPAIHDTKILKAENVRRFRVTDAPCPAERAREDLTHGINWGTLEMGIPDSPSELRK